MGRYLYTIKDRASGEVLFVGGEGASAQFLGCDPAYMSSLARRETASGKRTFYGDKEVTRVWAESSVQCQMCGIVLRNARPNRKYCSNCAKKVKRKQSHEGITMQSLQEDGTYIHIQEKQRQMQEECRGCVYFGGENYANATCNYIFVEGHSRGDRPGEKCSRRKERQKK